MIQAQKLFHDPIGMKRAFTFGQIEPFVFKRRNASLDYVNEAKQTWNDPTSLEETSTDRSEEHTSELQSLMRLSYAVFCLKKKTKATPNYINKTITQHTQ